MIAAKNGHLLLLKWLIEVPNIDVHCFNKRNENIIFLTAVGQKKKKLPSYLEIIKYLVEKCKVNVAHEYEELLLVLEDRNIVQYIEERLTAQGITNGKKNIIDYDNSLNKNRPPRQENPEMDRRLAGLGDDWKFCEVFQKELYGPPSKSLLELDLSAISKRDLSVNITTLS